MRRILVSCLLVVLFVLLVKSGWAQETAQQTGTSSSGAAGSATEAIKETAASLAADLKKARGIILEGSGGNPFGRGFMVALFEPVFIASMFCMGLWAGQINGRMKNVWAVPVIVYAATVIGAFITAYHSDWKPDFHNEKFGFLAELDSTNAVTALIGTLIGGAVGLGFTIAPIFALIGVGCIGLALGFSQTTELGDHKNAVLPFWSGFGLTGLLINIFGIGFETFMVSINLGAIIRWIGLSTVALSMGYGAQVF